MASSLATQVFSKDIQNGLWPVNDFLSACKDDSQFVGADSVNLPHAGTAPTVEESRSAASTPAKRTDAATTYPLLELSTDTTWLQYSEELIVNYNKRESILSEHRNALQKGIAIRVAHKWAQGGDSENSWATKPEVVLTSGTARAVNMIQVGATALTGTRKPVVLADVMGVINALNKSDAPSEGRYGLIPYDMFGDIMLINEFKSADFVNVKPLPGAPLTFGWLGITWFVRSFVTHWVKTLVGTQGALKAPTASSAADDCVGGIFWQKDHVRMAKGDVKAFLNIDMANLYGSQMSALARYGAIGARKDGKGIVNLIETWAT